MPTTIKRKALENLRQHILEEKPLVNCLYVEEVNGETCYCAVGHIMNSCGIDLTEMYKDIELNGSGVYSEQVTPFVQKLQGYGFTLAELTKLQNDNDGQDYEAIAKYIDNLLVEF